ncbi:hypothetical protein BT93_D0327 [Corymbia citriodora subsp. variegata]|nr:hypothetical protein BT93_D0327 [Corymbia citriodora subsp. variegata]
MAAAAAVEAEAEGSAAAAAGGRRGRKSKKGWGLWSPRRRAARSDRAASWWARLKFLGSAFRWKRVNIQLSFFDDVVFKLVSVLEAIVLVSTLGFFYLFCGCHF